MKSHQQFFAELKRRKVFRVAAVYGAVAFVLLQVADLLGQGLRLPESFMPFITAVVLLGFPLALVLAWAFEVTPEGVQRTDTAAPGEIEAIVAAPPSRRWPAGLLALVGVAALLAGAWWAGRTTAPKMGADGASRGAAEARLAFPSAADDGRPSIAVLPFVNMSADPEQEYFSDGMTEEILNVLAKLEGLRVTARTSTFAFKGENIDLRAVGDSLGVRYLIEGSVRKAGDQLRITAQLIDASDGSHLWSEQYDRQMENVFEIQSDIARAVADALTVPLGLEDDERLVAATADLEAYDLYLAGRARMRERGESLSEAIRLFEAAIARDSNWAPAWAGLAEASEIRLWYVNTGLDAGMGGAPPADMMMAALDKAERAARRALELDPGSAPARVALANVLRDRFEWNDAEAAYREALAIDPDYSEAHQQYAELLLVSGRIREAVRSADRAAILDPAPVRFNILGFTLFADGRDAEAIRAFERGISLDPDQNMIPLRNNLGMLHHQARRFEEAYEVWSDVPTLRAYWRERVAWMEGGRLEAIPDSARRTLHPMELVHLGELDRAADRLGEPPQSNWVSSLYVVWLPLYDPIRDRPPVRAFLRDKNLEGVTVQRTPPDERQLPTVLRATSVEATP